MTQVVAWAASNGDRSENADYQYGKRKLRSIDRRIRFLTKRIDAAEVVDPEAARVGAAATRIFFGRDGALRQCRWNGAGSQRRRPRRGRSRSQPHQLVIATSTRVDEVRTRRRSDPSRPAWHRAVTHRRGALRTHSRGAVQRTTWGRCRYRGAPSHRRRERAWDNADRPSAVLAPLTD